MFFESERTAFEAYAKAMPNNCVFLVDTYNSLQGVRHAIDVARQLRKKGHEMIGVRLDSGDRVRLSIEARRMLDEAGFTTAKIVCSGDLDEHAIAEMKRHGAKIDMWGVGTKLTTGQPDAALGGIYKLGAVRRPGGQWQYRIKLSDERAKTSSPGRLQVRRFHRPGGEFVADVIYEIDHRVSEPCTVVDLQTGQETKIPAHMEHSELLVPIFRKGELVYQAPNLVASRENTRQQVSRLPAEVARLDNPRAYPVGLEKSLHELRSNLIAKASQRQTGPDENTDHR
jgi:nicotinate phosphoribosyltransferase